MRIFFLLVALFLFSSCIKEEVVEYNVDQGNLPVIVIAALSPRSDSIHIYLKKSVQFGKPLKQEDENLFGANVTITNQSGKSIQLTTKLSSASIYSASAKNFEIHEAETYYLEVTTPEGNKIRANTTVPKQAEPLTRLDSGAYYTYNYTLIVPIYGSWKNDTSGNYGYRNYYQYVEQGNTQVTNTIDLGQVKYNGEFYSFEEELPFFINSDRPLKVDQRYDFFVVKTDQHLKSYLRISDLFDAIYNSIEDSEALSLLTSYKGVIPQESNIEGGIGVFGSYVKSPSRSIQIQYNQ